MDGLKLGRSCQVALGRSDVIRAASVFRADATAFLGRSVCGCRVVVAASECRVEARRIASGVIQSGS